MYDHIQTFRKLDEHVEYHQKMENLDENFHHYFAEQTYPFSI